MARKRMFSNDIVDTDKFLNMPTSTQLLYFQFGMKADDDGFIGSAQKIMKCCGCKQKDLDRLIQEGYIARFDSGVCYIRNWEIHNTIRKDRYTPTQYGEEALMVCEGWV